MARIVPAWLTTVLQQTKRLAKGIVLATVTTAISLGLAEAAVRIFNLGPQIAAINHGNFRLSDDPLLRYELAPGSTNGDSVINRDGLRDREFPLAKPPHTFRIACIGDSITFGFGVDQAADTYPKRLEYLLNTYCATPDQHFEVMNFGVPGYNLKEIVENVQVRVLKYHPDLVIYGYCLNDPQEISLEFLKVLSDMTGAERKYKLHSQQENFWMAHSRIFRLAAYEIRRVTAQGRATGGHVPAAADPENIALRSSRDTEYFTALHTGQPGRDNLENSLATLASACARIQAPVCVLIFPVTNHLDPYPLDAVHRQVAELCEKHAFHVCDLLESFRAYEHFEKSDIYFDYLHPFPLGDHYTAVVLLSKLLQDSLLPQVEPADVARRLLNGDEEDRRFGHLTRLLPDP